MRTIKNFFYRLFMWFCYIIRDRKAKSVFFCSFHGQYSDNPRAISECLHKLAPEIDQIWLLTKKNEKYAPNYVKVVYPETFMALIKQAQSKIWVLNDVYSRKGRIYKGKKTFYIQTWHGDRGIKRIGYLKDKSNRANTNGPDLSKCDLYVVASEYGEKKARFGQRYEGEFIKEGMPRNDKLVNVGQYANEISKIKEKLEIEKGKKILLYAPTFRDGFAKKQKCIIDVKQSLGSLSRTGEEWVCLIRAHSNSMGLVSNGSEAVDVTTYPDMADLLLISDALITDYSSCAGDFVLTGKPVILVHFDQEIYQTTSRTLWVSPNEIGYLIANNQEELNKILSNLNSYNHKSISGHVQNFYKTYETGHSSEYLAKRIIKEINSSF